MAICPTHKRKLFKLGSIPTGEQVGQSLQGSPTRTNTALDRESELTAAACSDNPGYFHVPNDAGDGA